MAELPISAGAKSVLATHVTGSGWTIEIGVLTAQPDRVMMISDTGGEPSNPKFLLDFPTLQILVRGNASGYLEAWAECKAVKDIMLGFSSASVNGDRWVAVNLISDIAFIGRDDNQRPQFTVNFQLIVEPQVPVGSTNRVAL